MSSGQLRPELLAPAGNWDCARAAVANGADAIYFGLPAFNARMRADNFTEADLPALMRFIHAHGVRGYLTLNILIFTSELAQAATFLREAEEAGVDAIIVQDLGLVRLARAVAPRLEIHASTQMTITSPEGVHFARTIGVDRVVVARELSLRELAKFRPDDPDMLPVETFVHGALCVAYSGQCLTSESLGQRSANRGECAQACRLPYDLVVDGTTRDLGDKRYLLSPQDLAAIDDIPALIEAGVMSFKIEGRLKAPEYVAAVTQVYRRAIDAALKKAGETAPAAGARATSAAAPLVSPEDRYKLEMTFSRGLFSGWLHGVDHQRLVHARFGTKRGPFAGVIARVGADFVEFTPEVLLKPGDGVVFETGLNPDDEQGGRIYEVRGERLYFQRGKINFRQLRPGHRVWKNSDPALEREMRKSFEQISTTPDRPLTLRVSGAVGQPLRLELASGDTRVAVESTLPLQPARAHALTPEMLREQLGRLGGSGYTLAALDGGIEGATFLPLRELNELRRRGLEALAAVISRASAAPSTVNHTAALDQILATVRKQRVEPTAEVPVRLAVLCRTIPQIAAALECGVDTVYVDFEDIRRYPEAVALGRTRPGATLLLATPRIQKAGEQGFFKLIENAGPQGVLIRNLGGLAHFQDSPLQKVGDFSLNVANPITAALLMERGFDRLTVSYDLNHQQVGALLAGAPGEWFELTIHQHMPLFHMEHCVFAAFLSNGHTHLDCGRVCEKHEVRLRDRLGIEHPVKVDVGCRNTVYHAKAQSGANYLSEFVARGLRRVRVELVDEDGPRTATLIRAYQALLRGEIAPPDLLSRLKVASQLGVTEGTLAVIR
ncbi:MAG: U32 family peptidase [Opitutaceae bacterium]|nr:U32 family peptidase [Opitutaceae bacterium]